MRFDGSFQTHLPCLQSALSSRSFLEPEKQPLQRLGIPSQQSTPFLSIRDLEIELQLIARDCLRLVTPTSEVPPTDNSGDECSPGGSLRFRSPDIPLSRQVPQLASVQAFA